MWLLTTIPANQTVILHGLQAVLIFNHNEGFNKGIHVYMHRKVPKNSPYLNTQGHELQVCFVICFLKVRALLKGMPNTSLILKCYNVVDALYWRAVGDDCRVKNAKQNDHPKFFGVTFYWNQDPCKFILEMMSSKLQEKWM